MSDFLPPGCTDLDIEERFGFLSDEEEDALEEGEEPEDEG